MDMYRAMAIAYKKALERFVEASETYLGRASWECMFCLANANEPDHSDDCPVKAAQELLAKEPVDFMED